MVEDTLQNEKYIQAIKALEKHGKVSDHHKVPETPEEKQFMLDVNKTVSKTVVTIPYKNNQYETIFNTPIKQENTYIAKNWKKYEGFLPD